MDDYFELDFLDVETAKSGDAICVRYRHLGVEAIHVVDGGYVSTASKVLDHLQKHYGDPSKIDRIVVTHNDGDHTRGLRQILEEKEVSELWMLRPWLYAAELLPRFPTYSSVERLESKLRSAFSNLDALEEIAVRKGIPIREPFQGAIIGAFTVMAPTRSRYLDLIADSEKTPESKSMFESVTDTLVDVAKAVVSLIRSAWGAENFPSDATSTENEMSVVQYAQIAGKKILLTGDTGRQGLQEVINFAPFVGLQLPGIDRFQVPHHGGRRNVNSELLDQILGERLPDKPATTRFTAIISSAKLDEDHPRKVVVRAMIHRGATVVTTEGRSIRSSWNAPDREGWVSVAGVPYPDEQEE